jgi:hypothetical protein
VRANAGADSFRSSIGLRKCLKAAKDQVRQAKAMLDKAGAMLERPAGAKQLYDLSVIPRCRNDS